MSAPFENCWIWPGKTIKGGYGYRKVKRDVQLVHRVAWELLVGPIPPGLHVLHHCDNPLCFNPDHLFLGTQADNNRDRDSKQRQARGQRVNTCRLTPEQVIEIRASTASYKALGRTYGVASNSIRAIKRGKTWKHL